MKAKDLSRIALFAALIAVCSWISVPGPVPFTLQTFAVFLCVGLLGCRRAMAAVAVYLMLGAVGLPVFAGFKGGLGALLGVTGGYLIGFLALVGAAWALTALLGDRPATLALSLAAGLFCCYAFGTAWFVVAYAKVAAPIGFGAALAKCVLPFLLPDGAKLALALLLTKRLRPLLGK